MIISHNILAMNAQRQLNINTKAKSKSTEKLSSGYKINRAADDAAGLAISEKMRRQIRGLTQGVDNTLQGISLCNVADGALNEVSDILNRMETLSVQASNDTNSHTDREYIQQEIEQLVTEIDRIAETTSFNEVLLFDGKDEIILNSDGTPATDASVSFSDMKLADLTLGQSPFSAGSGGQEIGLSAIVDNPALAADGKKYNLIYGNGSTSNTSMRLEYNGQKTQISLNNLTPTNFSSGTSGGKAYWTRDFNYSNADGVNLTVTQKIALSDDTASDKNYLVSYTMQNNSAFNVDMDFMFNADTAYNNNDICEGYFVNGNRVDKYKMFSAPDSKFNNGSTSAYIDSSMPNSFSIVDVDNALAFSEKIQIDPSNKPDSISIGHYSTIRNWDYYDNLNSNLGHNAIGSDLGFSFMWNDDLASGGSKTYSFKYGISAVEGDPNLSGVPIQKSSNPISEHYNAKQLWIQSGSEQGVGMYVVIEEMNSRILGVHGMNVTMKDAAQTAIEQTKTAQQKIMHNRSGIGAQQNRLEHTVSNENNIIENTTAAESQIRDTDMAKEMVQFSNLNILEQAGVSLLAQANQKNQNILSLLQ